MTDRLPGWEHSLAKAIDAARDRPFCWGQHDCAIWAFDLRRELTGCYGNPPRNKKRPRDFSPGATLR